MYYIYSTATCPISYVKYKPSPTTEGKDRNGGSVGHNQILRRVTINGGHGVNTKQLFTPRGVVTQISDDDFEFLMKDEAFKRHMDAGYMSFDKKKTEPEKKAKNMADKDGSSPLTEKDFERSESDTNDCRIYKGIAQPRSY
jgi:hypothetical protein